MNVTRSFLLKHDNTPLHERMGVIALVLLLHAGLGLAWMMQPEQPKIVVNEMSVSIAMQQAAVARPQAQPEPPPPKPQPKVERAEQPVPKPIVREVAETAPQPAPVAAPPVAAAPPAPAAPPSVAAAPVPDTEPDFRASHLDNPRPPYPPVARRMNWEGRVMLNVEILADGTCGGISVISSSGHEVLDKAAMKAVKTWRFVPARHAGQAITKWTPVPVVFKLEDNEA